MNSRALACPRLRTGIFAALAVAPLFVGAAAFAASPLDTYKQLARACVGGHASPEELDKDCKAMTDYTKRLPKLGYCLGGNGGLWDWRQGAADSNGKCKGGTP
jgi:hypothetical protein